MIFGALGMRYMDKIRGEDAPFGFLIGEISCVLCFLLIFYVHIILHEAGHLVFGLLSGYGFSSFRVGNIMLVKKNGKIKVKKLSIMGTGGQCLMVPPECPWEKLPYRLYNMGGVLMNLIIAVLAGGIFLFAEDYLFIQMISIDFFVIGMAIAIANGMPLFGQVQNDGVNTCCLSKSSNALRSFGIQMKINALLIQEV